MGRALQNKQDTMGGRWVEASRQELAQARMEDIKAIWEATHGFSVLHRSREAGQMALEVGKDEFDWEFGWAKLNQIKSFTEGEFAAEIEEQERRLYGEYSESEEEHGVGDSEEDDLEEDNGGEGDEEGEGGD